MNPGPGLTAARDPVPLGPLLISASGHFCGGQTAPPSGYVLMGPSMTTDPSDIDDLLRRAQAGDRPALAELFTRYRERLRQMVRLRLDRRLQGRLDPDDVLQEAYLDFARRLP